MVEFYIPSKEVEDRLLDKSIPKNGCGSGWSTYLVPDSFILFDFTIPCAIHDEMYFLGKTIQDKEEADRVFLNNMLREANSKSCFIRPIARAMAYQYYDKVVKYGGTAYWDGKNKENQMKSLVIMSGKIIKGLI